jgi:transcriptional regulator with XRE-family HTH domain
MSRVTYHVSHLYFLRCAKGFTSAQELAQEVRCSANTILDIERGKHGTSEATLRRLAHVLLGPQCQSRTTPIDRLHALLIQAAAHSRGETTRTKEPRYA